MKINVAIASPLYEESYSYNKKRTVTRVKEQCKKNLLLRITIGGVTEEFSRQIFNRILEHLRNINHSDAVKGLSDCEWGESYAFDEGTYTLTDCICIPKDFDSLDEQKKTLLKESRDIIRTIKRETPSEYKVLDA